MSLPHRPSGLPRRIPDWAWKWLKWRTGHPKPKPAPTPAPTPTPGPKLPLRGCDYVSGPTPAALKAAGIKFVCRYLSTPGNPKNLTKTEAANLRGHGISIVLVFETTADRALGGSAVGRADAQSARNQANALGVPASVPIYFAVDFDATPAEQTPINNYLRGAATVLGKNGVGIYGGFYPVSRALKAGVCEWGWQTYAWSGGLWYPGRHIEQYQNGARIGGHSVDLDKAVRYPYGAWEPS